MLDDFSPEDTSRPHLRDFHKVVLADSPEEAKTFGEGVNLQAGVNARANVFETVSQRVTEFNVSRRARLLHVVAAD